MKDIDGLELSPKKCEYLKYILEHGGTVHTMDLSGHFSLDPSTITKTIGEMASTGLIEHEPYRGVRLTVRGKEFAEFLVRRHRLIELMLSHYGLTAGEACAEASKFEGYVSKEVVDKICTSLGHPNVGICGRIKHDTCCCCPEQD
jgi:DtxR family transcriptional regulator, Mn-dependent transcriptional regulator